MRFRHLSICTLVAAALLAAGCSEEKSGLGEGKEEHSQEANHEAAPAQGSAQESGAASSQEATSRKKPEVTVPKGPPPSKLETKDLQKGTGAVVKPGGQLTVNYVGVSYSTGKEFDNSFDRGEPFPFELGAGMVIPGWDQGLKGMKVGGRRRLTIPAELGYGAQGQPPTIKPNETLVFVIDLLAAR